MTHQDVTIPAELIALPQWVTWRRERGTKVPYNARTGRHAKSTDPTTWSTYEIAVKAAKSRRHDGIGFVFTDADPFTGIDLDDCIDDDGNLAAWARDIVSKLDSYTEVSPSGKGLKIWVIGAIPSSVKTANIEMYSSARYFTVTGAHYDGTPTTIRTANGELDALYTSVRPASPAPRPAQPMTNRPAGTGHLQVWADRKIEASLARVRSAPDGTRHNTLVAEARLLGGLLPHGLASEIELQQLLEHAASDNGIHVEAPHMARKAIEDGLSYGHGQPLELPPDPPQPVYDATGIACCPRHGRQLSRGKRKGWYCSAKDESTERGWCDFWWAGDGYTGPETNTVRDVMPLPADPQTGETRPARKSEIIIEALTALGYTFRLNECNNTIEVSGVPIDDVMRAEIRTQMRDIGIKPLSAVEDAYLTEAAKNAYHPVRDYLNALEWDGQPHISRLAACFTDDDPPVYYDDGTELPLSTVYLYRWLIGAVAKALGGHQNVMLVLCGGQGLGKSAWVRWLCAGIPEYFVEAPLNPNDKDVEVRLMSNFLWEVSELDATTRKADVSALKAFITKQRVVVRKAYDHHDTRKPALASFVGTVNDSSGFLTDDTGNRRFMVTNIINIDWDYTKLNVDQIWAEAVMRYRRGEPWVLQPNEATMQREVNKRHEAESLLDGWIERLFEPSEYPQDRLTTSDIADVLRDNNIRLSGSERAQAMEISRVLARAGYAKIREARWRGFVGIRTRLS